MALDKEKDWNSATTLCIARHLDKIASGRKIKVLDMGCGSGTVLDHLLDMGLDLYGYDFKDRYQAKGGVVGRTMGRILDKPGNVITFLITHFLNAAFCFKSPKKDLKQK